MRQKIFLLVGAVALALSGCAGTEGQSGGGSGLAAAIANHPNFPELASGQKRGEIVSFPGASRTLRGFLYKPTGKGPFKAVIWNHGSMTEPGSQQELAAFYNRHGFVFFMPHRTGHGRSSGTAIRDRLAEFRGSRGYRANQVRLLEADNADVVAAVKWLKAQPFVDPNRIVMSGYSFGGIQTLLSAEKGLGVSAFISFAPAAMSWRNTRLRNRLLRAVQNAKAPIFMLQAKNDFSTGPSETLGPAIRDKGAPNRAVLYPAFGTENRHGHRAFSTWDLGAKVWGADVLAFIETVWSAK